MFAELLKKEQKDKHDKKYERFMVRSPKTFCGKQEVISSLILSKLFLSCQARKATANADDEIQKVTMEPFEWPGIRIFEALSATGLRSLRYFQEIPDVSKIVVNDLDPGAVETIRKNIRYNGCSTEKMIPSQGDANYVMMKNIVEQSHFEVHP